MRHTCCNSDESMVSEEDLALRGKMESIGRLASGIAHEVNTPLQYVGNNVQFLAKSFEDLRDTLERYLSLDLDGVDPQLVVAHLQAEKARARERDLKFLLEEIPGALEEVRDGVDRVSHLVTALKKFGHPSDGRKRPTDLNRCLENTVAISRNEWKYSADLYLDLSRSLPLVPCLGDEINQVILNLLVNASDAVKEAIAERAIHRGEIRLVSRESDGGVEMQVIDNGVGVEPENRDKIYDLFFTTKPVGKGTGQGLALARDIVVGKHKGRLEYRARESGSCFTVWIPGEIR